MRIRHETIDLSSGSIVRGIIALSIPIVLGELFQNLYNSVDALVVGNLVSKNALAAVTVSGFISNMVVNFFNGMSVGANVVVSKAFGAGDPEVLHSRICVTFTFGIPLGITVSLLGILFTPQLLDFAGTQPEYYGEALTYLRIYLAGLMFTVIYNNGAGILRAVGNSALPFRILVAACCVNVVLDLLFVGLFRMDVAGVALATAISQAVSVVLVYFAINRSQGICCVNFRELRHGRKIVLSSLRVGMAAGVQSALIGFSNLFVARYMNYFDTASVAGIGIAQRLDRFIVLPAKSFGITMTTFVGQNIGAKRYDRVKEGKNKCLAVALGVTVSLSLIILVFAEQSVRLFNSDPTVVSVGVDMMYVLVPLFWTMAVREVYTGVLRGCGKNIVPMLLNLAGMVGVRQVFLMIAMGKNPVIFNIYVCYPIAWAATAVFLLIYYRMVREQLPGLGRSYTAPEQEAPLNPPPKAEEK